MVQKSGRIYTRKLTAPKDELIYLLKSSGLLTKERLGFDPNYIYSLIDDIVYRRLADVFAMAVTKNNKVSPEWLIEFYIKRNFQINQILTSLAIHLEELFPNEELGSKLLKAFFEAKASKIKQMLYSQIDKGDLYRRYEPYSFFNLFKDSPEISFINKEIISFQDMTEPVLLKVDGKLVELTGHLRLEEVTQINNPDSIVNLLNSMNSDLNGNIDLSRFFYLDAKNLLNIAETYHLNNAELISLYFEIRHKSYEKLMALIKSKFKNHENESHLISLFATQMQNSIKKQSSFINDFTLRNDMYDFVDASNSDLFSQIISQQRGLATEFMIMINRPNVQSSGKKIRYAERNLMEIDLISKPKEKTIWTEVKSTKYINNRSFVNRLHDQIVKYIQANIYNKNNSMDVLEIALPNVFFLKKENEIEKKKMFKQLYSDLKESFVGTAYRLDDNGKIHFLNKKNEMATIDFIITNGFSGF